MKMTTSRLITACVAMFVFGLAGGASASLYEELYEGNQRITQGSADYYFLFDIAETFDVTLANLTKTALTNSTLSLTNDASGFDFFNKEQLDFVQIQIDVTSADSQPEAFNLDVDIYNSRRDFSETVTFDANQDDRNFNYTYFLTKRQINGWENAGWGELTIDAFNISGKNNFNDFRIRRVALSAGTTPVPEPSIVLLIGAGVLGLLGYRRSRKDTKS